MSELGRLVDVHRPMNPLLAAALVAVGPILIAILPAIAVGLGVGLGVGLIFVVGFGVPILYGFGELLFLQHRIHEHAIVTRSLPGLRTYVVPHYTIDPESVWVPQPDSRWSVSYRNAEQHRHLLAEAVRSSQRTRPYYRAGWTPRA